MTTQSPSPFNSSVCLHNNASICNATTGCTWGGSCYYNNAINVCSYTNMASCVNDTKYSCAWENTIGNTHCYSEASDCRYSTIAQCSANITCQWNYWCYPTNSNGNGNGNSNGSCPFEGMTLSGTPVSSSFVSPCGNVACQGGSPTPACCQIVLAYCPASNDTGCYDPMNGAPFINMCVTMLGSSTIGPGTGFFLLYCCYLCIHVYIYYAYLHFLPTYIPIPAPILSAPTPVSTPSTTTTATSATTTTTATNLLLPL